MRYFAYCRKSSEAEERQALSLESQKAEIARLAADQAGIQIVEIIVESKSAKAPGRPAFNEMLKRIERGEAEGIIAWHPDRLARNSVDGGLIIYQLDQGVIKDLKFANFSFENSSQGKFMLQIMFGYSKYYVDSLSENVKRGMRAKVARGWFPAVPPIGFKNDRTTNTIIRDPGHFEIVQRLLALALTGNYTAKELCLVARDEWHYLTPKHRRMGGTLLSLNTTYRILQNVFYAGHFYWNGVLYKGNHESMITLEEHERIQETVFKRFVKRPKLHAFPYTGLMRCGECGLSITAERHMNRFGSRYVYYRCTKRRLERCRQPFIEARALVGQFVSFLHQTSIPPDFETWIIHEGMPAEAQSKVLQRDTEASIARTCAELAQQLSNLTDLRIRNHIQDDEYLARRRALEVELRAAQEKAGNAGRSSDWFEPLSLLISFNKCAVPWFINGDDETRRIILKTAGSNPLLRDRKVSIDRAKPFVPLTQVSDFSSWSARLHEVRTLIEGRDPETMAVLASIKALETRKNLVPQPLAAPPETLPASPPEEADEEIAGTC